MDMQTQIPTLGKLYAALSRAVKRAEAVEKDAANKFHGYKYASAEAIIAEAREALSSEGLAVFPVSCGRDPEQPEHKWEGEGDKAFIDVPRRLRIVYRLAHESGESVEIVSTCPVIPEKGRPEDKAEFGARTEDLGYTLRGLLNLPRVDGDATPSARNDTGYEPRGKKRETRTEKPEPDGQALLGEADALAAALRKSQTPGDLAAVKVPLVKVMDGMKALGMTAEYDHLKKIADETAKRIGVEKKQEKGAA